ncbi:hypothetical protein AB3A93_000189 [Vibrio parahaemolyticus]|nr:hypothetical protein [Vibrio parahaemolyticus]
MNPIDKVTDPSFTESAKGLMVLFCIGAIHLVIGVELTNARIAIPWFPTVNFKHLEYLVYLYWALSFYAMYRYSLHNATLIREQWFKSLYEGLRGPSGKRFIKEAIFLQDASYDVETKSAPPGKNISIVGYQNYADPDVPGGTRREHVYYFYFKYTLDYRFREITSSSDPDVTVSGACFKNEDIRNKWGLDKRIDDDEHEEYKAYFIKSKLYKLKLTHLRLKPFIGALLTQKSNFDLCVPLILNISLFVAWVLKVSLS